MALPPGSNPDQSMVEQVYFSADKADIAKQPLLAQRNYEKLSNVIQTQQYAAEENKNDELISSLTDLQTNCFQPKLSALFEFNYKNIYQQLPQDVLQAVAKRLTEPKYMAPINADLLFKNFPLPKVVAAPPKKPSFKHFKPIAVPSPVTNTTPQNNGHNTNNNHHVNATRSNGTYVSPFNNHHHDSMDIDSDNNSHVTSNQSHVSAVNNNSHVARPQQSNTTNNSKDQLLPSRANNTSNNAVNKTSPPLPQKQPPTAANNTSAANKSNGTSANKTTPNMNSVTNSLLNKRPRNTFYGKASGENDDEEEEQSPPQQQDKPRDFKTGFERLQEENAKNGQSTSTTSSANSRTQLLGKRKRNFQTPFKKSPEEEEEEARAAKKAKETTEQPLYKNVDPEMIERIENEILEAGVQVKFDDIAGLENVKKTLDEMIIQPAKRPDLFQGLRAPPRGLLLFGPPGNGKTMIAKAIATEAGLTFFSISASSLTSKWIGEGEKMVRALFAVAKVHQPSFIFIDEIDALLAMRSNEEHESSRRLKNEFLTQFDGATTSAKERVTVMGATNRPQDLDEAARRRLVRRIYVPLPGKEARMHLMQYLLSNESHTLTRGDLEMLGDMTEGYSGHDITNLCKDAAMGPLREHQSYIATVDEAAIRPVNIDDFRASLSRIKPSVAPEETQQFEDWNTKFGVSAF